MVAVALLFGPARLIERRAITLTRAEVATFRADDLPSDRHCVREDYGSEGMFEILRDNPAILIDGEWLLERRSFLLGQAEAWASRAYDYGEGRGGLCFSVDVSSERLSVFCDRVSDLSVQLERKYRYAADHPWLSVGPDPVVPGP